MRTSGQGRSGGLRGIDDKGMGVRLGKGRKAVSCVRVCKRLCLQAGGRGSGEAGARCNNVGLRGQHIVRPGL